MTNKPDSTLSRSERLLLGEFLEWIVRERFITDSAYNPVPIYRLIDDYEREIKP